MLAPQYSVTATPQPQAVSPATVVQGPAASSIQAPLYSTSGRVPLTAEVGQTTGPPLPGGALLTQDNVITVILVCCVIGFFAAETIVSFVVRSSEGALQGADVSKICKYARIAAAGIVLKFMSLLVRVTASLALALGLFKAFADMARLVLPERALGLILFISYCGLISVARVVFEEMRTALSRLLSFGGSVPPSAGAPPP